MQELKNDSGLQLILNESFSDLPANYVASTFLTQQSNPSSNFRLQQAIIYNADMFGLAQESFVQTQTRDINRFKMYYRAPDLNTGADTVFMYVYVAHLKSSQGTSNQEERLSNAQSFTTNLGFLPQDANVILAGDFNVYESNEPAYQNCSTALISYVCATQLIVLEIGVLAVFNPKTYLRKAHGLLPYLEMVLEVA